MIEAQSLERRYGDFTAVRDVSFLVPDGQIMGILGPNGAGKTTTIRMITGFLPPTSGRVTVAGHDLFREPSKARREIGYLPENVALYPEMRVHEYLAYRARLEGLARGVARQAIGGAVERCLLREVENQIIGTLSKGYRQRVGLAAAILHRPKVLVLDEPTVGLDPKQIIAIRELIRELGEQRTLLLSTHILPEVEQLCSRVVIIDRGRLIAEGTPEELRQQAKGASRLFLTLKDDPAEAAEILGRLAGVAKVELDETESGRYHLVHDGTVDLREAVFRAAVERGWVLLELAEKKASLEDIFVRLTTADAVVTSAVPEAASQEAAA
ncbi:MAG: ABC transporter ATP-binding protein [Thermoanaerobaculia bacterium]|nr:ABC transporter ATP-binding protein [Thermoanaerobaculia bacterium]